MDAFSNSQQAYAAEELFDAYRKGDAEAVRACVKSKSTFADLDTQVRCPSMLLQRQQEILDLPDVSSRKIKLAHVTVSTRRQSGVVVHQQRPLGTNLFEGESRCQASLLTGSWHACRLDAWQSSFRRALWPARQQSSELHQMQVAYMLQT